jgi:hypothetical protein
MVFNLPELRIPLWIEPDTHGIGSAEEFTVHDLETARIAGVEPVVSHVEVPIHAGDSSAELAGHSPSLVGNAADPKDLSARSGGVEGKVALRAVDGQRVNRPGHASDPLVGICQPRLRRINNGSRPPRVGTEHHEQECNRPEKNAGRNGAPS